MTRSNSPTTTRAIQRKAAARAANERIADAARALVDRWAAGAATDEDMAALAAAVSREGKA